MRRQTEPDSNHIPEAMQEFARRDPDGDCQHEFQSPVPRLPVADMGPPYPETFRLAVERRHRREILRRDGFRSCCLAQFDGDLPDDEHSGDRRYGGAGSGKAVRVVQRPCDPCAAGENQCVQGRQRDYRADEVEQIARGERQSVTMSML